MTRTPLIAGGTVTSADALAVQPIYYPVLLHARPPWTSRSAPPRLHFFDPVTGTAIS